MAEAVDDGTYQELVNMGFTEEEIRDILELGALDLETAIWQRDSKESGDAMKKPGPDGRVVRNGIYVASSPLEHAGHAVGVMGAKRDRAAADERMRGLESRRVDTLLTRLRGGSRGKVSGTPVGYSVPGYEGMEHGE